MKTTRKNQGFTLAELLVVVAIIAILVAVAIPVFTASLDRANLAVDAATERQALAAASTEFMANQSWLDELRKQHGAKPDEGLYFFYDASSGKLVDAIGVDDHNASWLDPYKVGKWGDHKGKYLMLLIKDSGTILFRWGGDANGATIDENWGFGPAPSIAELQKTKP